MNILTNIVQEIHFDDDVKEVVSRQLSNLEFIYSYIVYSNYKNDDFVGWKVRYNVSQNEKYNTIAKQEVINNISKSLSCVPQTKVATYMQPDLNLLLKLYNPLIKRLATDQHSRWRFLELEDLKQMCRLVICNLYYSGYYIHKNLVFRAFNNYVLLHIRYNRERPMIISLDQLYHKNDDDGDVSIVSMVPDTSLLDDQENKENKEIEEVILNEMKTIVIDYIGLRQYDQLLREYKNKQTTIWSRKLMQQIKAHLFDMGINRKSFNKYYG